MTATPVSRVHYFDKQFLRVNEFRDEQLYQLGLRRRHNVALHMWGIVNGLELANEEGTLVVRPGMAIDGYGRELLLPDKKRIAPENFDDLATDRLDIWLVYGRHDNPGAPTGYRSCDAAGGAYRSDEVPEVLVERALSNIVDARTPPDVPEQVLNAPVPDVSDDPRQQWRVYLGRITRTEPGQYSIDLSQRPYVGVVAEVIDHPGNATRVEVGRQSVEDEERSLGGVTYVYEKGEDPANDQSRRFAVFVPEHLVADETETRVVVPSRFEILQDGTIRMRGRTVINGNLRVASGAIKFVEPAAFTAENTPQVPSIYRIQETGSDQLRVDLGAEMTLNRQFVIGFSDAEGKFTPCVKLELKDTTGSGTLAPVMTIFGDLKVEGLLQGDYVPRRLSEEATTALLASFQAGVAAGNVGP